MSVVRFPGFKSSHTDLGLSEILGALSHALDMTEGQPPGHCIRACWIGFHVGREMGLPPANLWELYYTLLLKDLGCSSNAARICELYLADDLAFKHDYKYVPDTLPQVLGFVISHTGLKAGMADRFRAILNILRNGGTIAKEMIETRCQRGAEIAARMRFPGPVSDGIRSLDEHWDGRGKPEGLSGPAIPVYSRIALLAQVVDVFHHSGGPEAALAEADARSGTWFDPNVVACLRRVAARPGFWDALASEGIEQAVYALEPATRSVPVDEGFLDDIAEAFALVVDSKSPYTAGHSDRVALYSDMIAEEMGYDAASRRWLRRAALLHDIGKLGVSNQILDKPSKLDDDEWGDMRRHSANSEAILSRIAAFADIARVGGSHHERLDGKGYPRGIKGDEICQATRIVSVADVFDALTADRPYRSAMPTSKAMAIMESEAGTAFDPACLKALVGALERASAPAPDAAAVEAA